MNTKESTYEKVYSEEYFGTNNHYKIKILMDIGRELTDVDKRNIRMSADTLREQILKETLAHSPEAKKEAKIEKDKIIKLFDNFSIFVEEIPNGYCSQSCCKHLPWFVITTHFGRIKIGWRKSVIKIGWRKSVINIDWTDSIISKNASELFAGETVTKGDKYIHAHGYEKAKEYINILLFNRL